jgi:itaconate CoA-transferase
MRPLTGLTVVTLEHATGRGRHIDISMLEALGEWMSYPLYYAFDGAAPPPRTGANHATIYPYGLFPTGDGKTVLLGLQNEREWISFCETVLQRPDLARQDRFAGNARRNASREELEDIIAETFAALTAPEVIARLEQARIANARANDMHELWEHPQLKARDRWRQVDTQAGAVPALLPPGTWDSDGPRMDPVPALGAHTDSILAELGYAANDIAALRAADAI